MLKERHGWEKYKGPHRIHEPAMKQRWNHHDFVFVCHMMDIGAPGIPGPTIIRVLNHIKKFPQTGFLFLTKAPLFYIGWDQEIPFNALRGATIETDLLIPPEISVAPSPGVRLITMKRLQERATERGRHFNAFISIEPIMAFSSNFHKKIIDCDPGSVAIGFDNYDNNLPEPTLEMTMELIEQLEEAGIEVHRKTLREHNGRLRWFEGEIRRLPKGEDTI